MARINPAFDRRPETGALIGKLVVSFGELELMFCNIAAMFSADSSNILRAIYRGRSTAGRIELADALVRSEYTKLGHYQNYIRTYKAVKSCLSIRNQYAHCHFADDDESDGLYFADIEETAARETGFEHDFRHVDLKLLVIQESYFEYAKELILLLERVHKSIVRGSSLPIGQAPEEQEEPSKHNPPDQHVPQFLNEEQTQRHLQRALEFLERANPPQRKRPASTPKLTHDEWIAKLRQEGWILPIPPDGQRS
jgi:hypothetical protein